MVYDCDTTNFTITIKRESQKIINQTWTWHYEFLFGNKIIRNFHSYPHEVFLLLNDDLEVCGGDKLLFNPYVVLTVEKLI